MEKWHRVIQILTLKMKERDQEAKNVNQYLTVAKGKGKYFSLEPSKYDTTLSTP
jgi:hypothetical protein